MRVESSIQTTNPPPRAASNPVAPGTQSGQELKQADSARASINASEQALNKSIISTSIRVSIASGNESLGLLLKSAIEGINDALQPEFGANAIQNAYDSGLDVSPQATADRIVSLSTAFFARYAESNPEKDLETALQDFIQLIGKGIDQGFKEARSILDGLQVLQGEIASNIDKTYELVQTGLQSFVEDFPRPEAEAGNSQ